MKKILFIGNSYTYFNDMPKSIFEKMAKSVGIDVEVSAITKGGETLAGHQTEGHVTYGVVSEIFEKVKFDFAVFQEQSDRPATDPEAYFEAIGRLIKRACGSGAECVVYGTWPKKAGHKNLEKYGMTVSEMAEKLDASFVSAAERFGARVALVGPCFCVSEDESSLPNPYSDDLSHPSYAGSYMAALCILNAVFGTDPVTVGFDGELDAKEASVIKETVRKIVL